MVHRGRLALLVALAVVAVAVLPITSSASPTAARAKAADHPPTKVTLHFKVTVGPAGQTETDDVVADWYTPTDATSTHPVPVILTTNGFGGSKDDQAYIANWLGDTEHDYAVLSYSGLGFGGSGGQIRLDDPDYDGMAASQLIDWIGGKTANAYTSYANGVWSNPVAPPDVVLLQGAPANHDPALGMIGGSYGGSIQFATASIDPRVDTIVPIITWNDLTYSLGPSNDLPGNGAGSLDLTTVQPGTVKKFWALLFSALGVASPLQNNQVPGLLQNLLAEANAGTLPCPGFPSSICAELVQGIVSGHLDAAGVALLRHDSVASYIDKIKIPTLLGQGQADTLFDLQESIATYDALRHNGVPVQLAWQSWGHSDSTPAKGEFVSDTSPTATVDATYEGKVVSNWFDYWLKPGHGGAPAPALDFSYFQPWVFAAQGTAVNAYAHAPTYPAGQPQSLYLSGTNQLVGATNQVQTGAATFVTAPGLPTPGSAAAAFSFSDIPGVSTVSGELGGILPAPFDLPGFSGSWTSAPLANTVDVVGVPTADLTLTAPGCLAPPANRRRQRPVGCLRKAVRRRARWQSDADATAHLPSEGEGHHQTASRAVARHRPSVRGRPQLPLRGRDKRFRVLRQQPVADRPADLGPHIRRQPRHGDVARRRCRCAVHDTDRASHPGTCRERSGNGWQRRRQRQHPCLHRAGMAGRICGRRIVGTRPRRRRGKTTPAPR